jgi:hypothetical protein
MVIEAVIPGRPVRGGEGPVDPRDVGGRRHGRVAGAVEVEALDPDAAVEGEPRVERRPARGHHGTGGDADPHAAAPNSGRQPGRPRASGKIAVSVSVFIRRSTDRLKSRVGALPNQATPRAVLAASSADDLLQ